MTSNILYTRELFNSMPRLISKIELDQWNKMLDIISDKDSVHSSTARTRIAGEFIPSILRIAEHEETNTFSFCLDELARIKKRVSQDLRKSFIGLEGMIADSVVENISTLTQPEITALHDIFYDIYHHSSVEFLSPKSSLDAITQQTKKLPPQYRLAALNQTRKVISSLKKQRRITSKIKSNNLEDCTNLVTSYLRSLQRNLEVLGNNFPEWTNSALRKHQSVQELIKYFDDVYGYFKEDITRTKGGLPLAEVNGRLNTYISALTGRNVRIEDSKSDKLSCTFCEGTYLFPTVINLGDDNETNFKYFKALGSYQAGAVMLGSYEIDVNTINAEIDFDRSADARGFFDSFSNTNFAKILYELFEFVRIDSHLKNKFPGLRATLDDFKIKVLEKESSSDIPIVRKIREYAYGVNNDLEERIKKEFNQLREDSLTAVYSAEAVYRIYTYLEKKGKVPAKTAEIPPSVIELPIDNFSVDKTYTYVVAMPGNGESAGKKFRYPEWDFEKERYIDNFVQVVETTYPDVTSNDYVSQFLSQNQKVVEELRRNFEGLKPEEFLRVKKQYTGDVNYDELVKAHAEMIQGITPSEKLYVRSFKNRRSVCSLVLSESSGSLRRFIDFNKSPLKIVDIVKQSKISFCEALEQIGDRYGLASFSGETERNVEFYVIKSLDQVYDFKVRDTIGSIKPLQQNRDGAGIRHATHILHQQPEKIKLFFYLMEGAPHDFGYEKKYAIEDTKKALQESKRQGCIPVVLAFGKKINEEVRSIGENVIYREIQDPLLVPRQLPELYRRISF